MLDQLSRPGKRPYVRNSYIHPKWDWMVMNNNNKSLASYRAIADSSPVQILDGRCIFAFEFIQTTLYNARHI